MKVYGAASLFFCSSRMRSCIIGVFLGSVDIPWGIIELILWRTALQADAYWTDVRTEGVALGY